MDEKNKKSFSLNDFKKWMSTSKFKTKEEKMVGTYVKSKLGSKRLMEKITPLNDENVDDEELIEEMAKDFKKDGGTIVSCRQDGMLTLEVDSGRFTIHRYFTKREDV